MSGPKVVRVVTREELVAAGQGLLARLDAAVAQWQRDGASHLNSVEIQKSTERRDALAAMLRDSKFLEFGQAVSKEIDFLEVDAQHRRDRVAQARAQERSRFFSGQELARTLLLGAAALPQKVREELNSAAAGRMSIAEMDVVLSHARRAMFAPSGQAVTQEQKALASRLAGHERELSLDDWKKKNARPDERLEAIFTHLSELETLGESAAAAALEQQLAQARSLADDAVWQMRLDTLVLAVRKAKDAAATKLKVLRSASLLAAELMDLAPSSETVTKLRSARASDQIESLQTLVAQGQEELTRTRAETTAAARRRAVLGGLQKMGYQVHEGLSTATASFGRIVVRSPNDNGYGVEVVAGAASDKVQVRSVAFDADRDASKDIPEEQRWCGDFGKLQANLHTEGCEIIIEMAKGVGTTPMKVLQDGGERQRRRSSVSPSKAERAR